MKVGSDRKKSKKDQSQDGNSNVLGAHQPNGTRGELTLQTPLRQIKGVGETTSDSLAKLGLHNVRDLIQHLPFRLEDRSQVVPVRQLRANEPAVIYGEIETVSTRRSKTGKLVVQAKLKDHTGSVSVLWFNQRFILKFLRPGETYYIYGQKRLSKALNHPFFASAIINAPEILPVYRRTSGITAGLLRRLLREVCAELKVTGKESARLKLLAECHLSPAPQKLERANQLLAYEELYQLAQEVGANKKKRRQLPHQGLTVNGDDLKEFSTHLPFTLTPSQKKAAWEIIQDTTQPHPMRRLLYGEVGSGKTAVSQMVTAHYLVNLRRVAVLAPTVALAHQLCLSFRRVFLPLGAEVAFLSGESKEETASASIVVGTHALLNQPQLFKKYGLVIIDEQHRFGVEQREKIINQSASTDLLMMTATPIPRTLAHTIFGDLDVSYLLDKPTDRQPVQTVVFNERDREGIENEIEKRIAAGQPGFVICPLIAEPNAEVLPDMFADERKTVTAETARLKKRFPNARIAMLHGRLSETNKIGVIEKFKKDELDMLVATTVIEVGIDVPAATWMLIENAGQFGLSQLHQLRGRIGRGKMASTCFLAAGSGLENSIAAERLRALEQANNGMELAELDLQLRGPGEITGLEQSGLPKLRYADWRNIELVKKVFADAEKGVVSDDLAAL